MAKPAPNNTEGNCKQQGEKVLGTNINGKCLRDKHRVVGLLIEKTKPKDWQHSRKSNILKK